MSEKCHVWMAPGWQEEPSRRGLGRCSHAIVMTGYKRVPGVSKETAPCGLNALETVHPLHS